MIPTFNEAGQIGKLIDLLHTLIGGPSYEIIVADGGSTDYTPEIAESAGARVVFCKHRRRSSQMNCGAMAATGEILYFLHADTRPPPRFDQFIERSVGQGHQAGCFRLKFMDSHPLLCLYGWCTRFDTDLFRFGDQSLFITRKLFLDINGYCEELILMEDQEIIRRIRSHTDFKLMEKCVVTSPRKYRENGVVRLQVIFCMIVLLYYTGARQETLVHFYHSNIDSGGENRD
ncbi:MAG: TIGR04283 family arsenosugar biosynthesis glycosyltransferase [Balneolaceae bacterium]